MISNSLTTPVIIDRIIFDKAATSGSECGWEKVVFILDSYVRVISFIEWLIEKQSTAHYIILSMPKSASPSKIADSASTSAKARFFYAGVFTLMKRK